MSARQRLVETVAVQDNAHMHHVKTSKGCCRDRTQASPPYAHCTHIVLMGGMGYGIADDRVDIAKMHMMYYSITPLLAQCVLFIEAFFVFTVQQRGEAVLAGAVQVSDLQDPVSIPRSLSYVSSGLIITVSYRICYEFD